ncbi:MAG: FG-GAP-like repeat-containing protein [Planctomycetota bacterium]
MDLLRGLRPPALGLLLMLVGCGQDPVGPVAPRAATPTGSHVEAARSILTRLTALEAAGGMTSWHHAQQIDAFIAERPFDAFGTLAKIHASKALTRAVWDTACRSATRSSIGAEELERAVELPEAAQAGPSRSEIEAHARSLGLKGGAADASLRIVLSVICDELAQARPASNLLPLTAAGADKLGEMAATLSHQLLREASARARGEGAAYVTGEHVQAAYLRLVDVLGVKNRAFPRGSLTLATSRELLAPLTKALIQGKLDAVETLDDSPGSVMASLARVARMPLTEPALRKLTHDLYWVARYMTAGFEPMRADNFLSDGTFAGSEQPRVPFLTVVQVHNTLGQLFPHQTTEAGDVVIRFEPNPGPQIVYVEREPFEIRLSRRELAGVRESGVAWLTLKHAWADEPFAIDPFGVDELAEALSMMLALWIRQAEAFAQEQNRSVIDRAVAEQIRSRAFVMVPSPELQPRPWPAARQRQKASLLQRYGAPLFRDASRSAGLTELGNRSEAAADPKKNFTLQNMMGGGIAVGDLEGDGDVDFFLAGDGMGVLLEQVDGVQFHDATARAGLPTWTNDAHGALFFDMDGDGDDDLLILRSDHPSHLFENDGQGKFVDVAGKLGFAPPRGAHVASVFDYDGDGDLDIYLGFYGSPRGNLPSIDGRNGRPNQLWQQQADGSLREVAREAGVDDVGWTLATGAFDYDNDGDLDLYLANDFGPNKLFRNEGGGRFSDVSDLTCTGDRGSGMNVEVTDVNSDGFWDLYITNIDMFAKNINIVFPEDDATIDIDRSLARAYQDLSGNKLFLNPGDRTGASAFLSVELPRFEPVAKGWGWDAVFFDVENDGDDDVYIANGWLDGSYAGNQENLLFLAEAGAYFVADTSGAEAFPGNTRSVAAVDVDNDGGVDLVANSYLQSARLLLNQAPARGNWIALALSDPASKNRKAVGARIEIRAGSTRVLRHVSAGRGYMSQAARGSTPALALRPQPTSRSTGQTV